MKKIITAIIILSSLNPFYSQWGPCDYIELSASDIGLNNFSCQLETNIDSLIMVGLVSSNVEFRWTAYSANQTPNFFDTSSTCSNCIWHSNLPDPIYNLSAMNAVDVIINKTIVDGWVCVQPFIVQFDPANPSNGGFSLIMTNQPTGIKNTIKTERKITGIYNLLGKEVNPNNINNEVIIYKYSDGTSKKFFLNK